MLGWMKCLPKVLSKYSVDVVITTVVKVKESGALEKFNG